MTLVTPLKSSEFRAIFWLILRHSDHELAVARMAPQRRKFRRRAFSHPAHACVVGQRVIRQRLHDAIDLIIMSALGKHQQLGFKLGQK